MGFIVQYVAATGGAIYRFLGGRHWWHGGAADILRLFGCRNAFLGLYHAKSMLKRHT
jgi:hypothetical protein